MAYQPPILVQRKPFRMAPRPVIAFASVYVGLAVCYSIGYGQAMSLMATTSDDANRILARQDYSRISGMQGPLSPLIEFGVLDAIRFQPKSQLFGVFSGLWSTSDSFLMARQNAGIVHPGPPKTGLSMDDLRAMGRDYMGSGKPAVPGEPGATSPIQPGSMSADELRRRAKAYAELTGQPLPSTAGMSKDEIRKRLKDYGITVTGE